MEKIILDCDPGHDDAIAILLAAGNPKIDLLGITTVSGNHNVDNTTRNALSVCTAYGIKVPVAKGSPGPLIIDQVLAVEIHGDTGLDGPVLPPASFALDKRHAVDFIIDTVMALVEVERGRRQYGAVEPGFAVDLDGQHLIDD